jgi:hypothetical protein
MPARAGTPATRCPRRGAHPSPAQDPLHRRGPDPVPQPRQLALHPPVPPARILPGKPLDQRHHRRIYRWPTRPSRIPPFPPDQPTVPAQQRARRHDPVRAQRRRNHPRQRRQHRPVRPRHPRTADPTAQYCVLMTQHQDLCVPGRIAASQQRQPAGHLAEDQIQQSEAHERLACRTLCTISPPSPGRRASQPSAKRWRRSRAPDRIPSSPRCDEFWVGTTHDGGKGRRSGMRVNTSGCENGYRWCRPQRISASSQRSGVPSVARRTWGWPRGEDASGRCRELHRPRSGAACAGGRPSVPGVTYQPESA